jgi:hypothetical protein
MEKKKTMGGICEDIKRIKKKGNGAKMAAKIGNEEEQWIRSP